MSQPQEPTNRNKDPNGLVTPPFKLRRRMIWELEDEAALEDTTPTELVRTLIKEGLKRLREQRAEHRRKVDGSSR